MCNLFPICVNKYEPNPKMYFTLPAVKNCWHKLYQVGYSSGPSPSHTTFN